MMKPDTRTNLAMAIAMMSNNYWPVINFTPKYKQDPKDKFEKLQSAADKRERRKTKRLKNKAREG